MPLWNGNGTVFQSTLLMRGATERQKRRAEEARKFQSTLLMRGATARQCREDQRQRKISIHAPHARSDLTDYRAGQRSLYFNPRSSCEERPELRRNKVLSLDISIHAPHARSDRMAALMRRMRHAISIHAPHARSDLMEMTPAHLVCISIHAPHARSDMAFTFRPPKKSNFNPRSSCEERRDAPSAGINWTPFQSTLLMRGATRVSLHEIQSD